MVSDNTLKLLTDQDSYRTQPSHVSWLKRKMPSWFFYMQVLRVVRNAARLSKQGEYRGENWIQSSLDILGALESVGVRLILENLKSFHHLDTPCVFIANHMSTLETFILPCLIRPYRRVTFVVKESLVTYPFFKHVMVSRRPIVVGRSNPRDDLRCVLREGQARLEENISVIIFPQTTRSVDFDSKKFNTIGVKLAARGQVPIVPIALRTDAWSVGKRLKDFGKIHPQRPVRICFGTPIPASGDSGKAAHHRIVRFISEKLTEWDLSHVA